MGTHSHSKPGYKMVAAQVLLGLWATGLAVAAPQLDFGDSRSVGVLESRGAPAINQNQVVSDVVSALQPSIEAAIAEALASLRSNSVSNSVSSSVFSSGDLFLRASPSWKQGTAWPKWFVQPVSMAAYWTTGTGTSTSFTTGLATA